MKTTVFRDVKKLYYYDPDFQDHVADDFAHRETFFVKCAMMRGSSGSGSSFVERNTLTMNVNTTFDAEKRINTLLACI